MSKEFYFSFKLLKDEAQIFVLRLEVSSQRKNRFVTDKHLVFCGYKSTFFFFKNRRSGMAPGSYKNNILVVVIIIDALYSFFVSKIIFVTNTITLPSGSLTLNPSDGIHRSLISSNGILLHPRYRHQLCNIH